MMEPHEPLASNQSGQSRDFASPLIQHTSLPNGFHYHTGAILGNRNVVMSQFLHHAELRSFLPFEIPPVGFKRTFVRGANVAEGKIFEFDDRGGRRLALTADGMAAILDKYVEEGNFSKEQRLAFVCPVFRYRRMAQRHYTQLGFSYINAKLSRDGEIDRPTLLSAQTLLSFIGDFKIPLRVEVSDFRLLRSLLSKLVGPEHVDHAMHSMRRMDSSSRYDWLVSRNIAQVSAKAFVDFVTQPYERCSDVSLAGLTSADMRLLEKMDLFITALAKSAATVRPCFGAFQGSELHDGIGLRFISGTGRGIGDGGDYSRYAKNFHSSISNFGSVAVSLDRIVEMSPLFRVPTKTTPSVTLLRLDASITFVTEVTQALYEAGIRVDEHLVTGSLKKNFAKLVGDHPFAIVLGRTEELKGSFELKDLTTRNSTLMDMEQLRDFFKNRAVT